MSKAGVTAIKRQVSYRIRRPIDVAAGLFAVQMFWAYVAYSQRSLLSFGPYVELSLPSPPSAVTVVSSRSSPLPTILVAYKDREGLDRCRLSPGGRLVQDGFVLTSMPIGAMTSTDLDGDGAQDVVALSTDGYQVEIIQPETDGRAREHMRLDHRAQRLLVADINNDGMRDLLFYGRHMAGVETRIGGRDGRFRPGPLLFPEISAGDIIAADLNGDRITDLVLLHWLSECLVVHFGIGREMFSEQVTLRLPSEPGRMAFMSVGGRRTLRFLVTLPQQRAVAHVIGTPAGEFVLRETIAMPARPLGIAFSLVNDDQLPDLVASTTGGFAVALGATSTRLMPVSEFGAGAESVSWVLEDIDADRKPDLVIADKRASKLVVLGNALHSSLVAWPREFAAGVQPDAMTVGDCTNDGQDDLLVANAGSSSVSVFVNGGGGTFLGQRTIPVPGKPGAIKLVRSAGTGLSTIVSLHPAIPELGITRFSGSLENPRLMRIPTESRPVLLLAETDPATQFLRILVRNVQNGSNRAPLALYEEIGGGQFLEHTYRSTAPTMIMAMTVGDFSGTMNRDLVVALRDRATRETTISMAPAQAGYDFRQTQRLFSIADTNVVVRYLWTGPLNDDSHADLLLYLSHPRPMLGYAYGAMAGTLALDSTWTTDVTITKDQALTLRDADGDGRTDIVYLDERRDGVYCMYGSPRGRFSEPRLVTRANGAQSFTLGMFDAALGTSIVLSHSARNTVSIHSGLFGK